MAQTQSNFSAMASQASRAVVEARMDRLPVTSRHRRIARVLAVGTFFDAFDALIIGVALTAISTTLTSGFVSIGLVISAGYAGQAIGALAIGAISDRVGRRTTFLAAIAIFSLLSIVCALAWNLEALTLARLIQGIGLGAEVPVAATLISEYAPALKRGRAVMLYQAIFAWGAFAAPLVGLVVFSLVTPDVGWRVLLGLGVLPLVIVFIGRRAIPESVRWLTSKGHVDSACSIVEEFESAAGREGKTLPEPQPVPAKTTLPTKLTEVFSPAYRTRTVLNAMLWFTTYFVTYGYAVWLPSLYVKLGGLPITQALYLTLTVAVGQIIAVYAFALTVDRIGRKPWLLAGYAAALAGAFLGLAMIALGIHGWPTLFAAGLLIAIGTYIPAAGLYLYIPELYPTRIRAWGTAAGSSMNRIASVISPLAVGALLARGLGLSSIFVMFAVVLLVGLIALAVLGRETKEKTLEQTADLVA